MKNKAILNKLSLSIKKNLLLKSKQKNEPYPKIKNLNTLIKGINITKRRQV